MIPVIPAAITTIVVASHVIIASAIWGLLFMGVGRSGLPPSAQRRVRIASGVFLAVWLGAIFLLAPPASSLATQDEFYVPPPIPLFFVLSVASLFVALQRSPSFRRALAAVPLPALHALHIWRILGIVFVILYVKGQLPPHFALPAGWGDVAIGVTAPAVALALARRNRGAAAVAVLWNVIGLVDLVVAIGMGTGLLAPLLMPELGSRAHSAAAMGILPMIVVPTFAVPVSMILHVLSLARLRHEARTSARMSPAVAHQGK
jgi:hypothetical protein